MKYSIFPILLCIVVAISIGYLSYYWAEQNNDPNHILVGIGTGLSVISTLVCVIGISVEDSRRSINIKVWSLASFVVIVAVNLCFARIAVTMPYYIIAISILFVIHLWVVWKLTSDI